MILDALAESARKRVAEAAKWRSLEEIRRQALSLPPKAAPFAFERVLRGKRLSLSGYCAGIRAGGSVRHFRAHRTGIF